MKTHFQSLLKCITWAWAVANRTKYNIRRGSYTYHSYFSLTGYFETSPVNIRVKRLRPCSRKPTSAQTTLLWQYLSKIEEIKKPQSNQVLELDSTEVFYI